MTEVNLEREGQIMADLVDFNKYFIQYQLLAFLLNEALWISHWNVFTEEEGNKACRQISEKLLCGMHLVRVHTSRDVQK